MAVSKDEILDAIGKMSVIEVVELIADMEKKFGVTAAAPVAMAAGPGGRRGGGSGRGADRVHRHAQGISGRQESDRHQGDPRDHRPGPEGSQGPGRGVPATVKEAVAKADVEVIKKKLEDVGAKVEVK